MCIREHRVLSGWEVESLVPSEGNHTKLWSNVKLGSADELQTKIPLLHRFPFSELRSIQNRIPPNLWNISFLTLLRLLIRMIWDISHSAVYFLFAFSCLYWQDSMRDEMKSDGVWGWHARNGTGLTWSLGLWSEDKASAYGSHALPTELLGRPII